MRQAEASRHEDRGGKVGVKFRWIRYRGRVLLLEERTDKEGVQRRKKRW